jgi:glutamine amidotransferase
MIAIIDYGMGNLRSVYNAFKAISSDVQIVNNYKQLAGVSGIVLPGVGAFGDGIQNLRNSGFADALNKYVIGEKKPFLGICLGLQLLGTFGYEYGKFTGLGWVPGTIEKMPNTNVRLPHIGWNDVSFIKKEGLYKNLGDTQNFYFVHSYSLKAINTEFVSGVCHYGENFVASIESENIYATQFHPEKSHKAGIELLKNWDAITKRSC